MEVWKQHWIITAYKKVHADLQLTFLLSVTQVRSPFANSCWNASFSRSPRKYQMHKKQNHILPFLFLHRQDISLVSLWECVNESSCDPGILLTTSVTLCSVPLAPDLHFKETKQFCYSRTQLITEHCTHSNLWAAQLPGQMESQWCCMSDMLLAGDAKILVEN